ncbi:hypothetical protein ACQUY5_20175 [Bacillus cereus]|uniref:hypothetical protein n=1 Tax=Bacillus cereus TaxID=1396 RepID=UPI003D18524A
MWLTVSYISVSLGVLFLVVTIVLCVKWDIVNIYDTITGRKAKRQIKKYRERDEGKGLATDSLTSGLSPTSHMNTQKLSLLEKSQQRGYKVYDSDSLISSANSQRLEKMLNDKGLTKTGEFIHKNAEIERTEIISEDSLEEGIQRTEILDLDGENEGEQEENLVNLNKQPLSVRQGENEGNTQENVTDYSDVTQILVEDEEETVSPKVETIAIQSGVRVPVDADKTQLLEEATQLLEEGTAILSEDGSNTSRLDEQPVSSNRIIIKQRGSSYKNQAS